jgi:hypothetical protein
MPEWFVQVSDKPGTSRVSVREKHIQRAKDQMASGEFIRMGGAYFEDQVHIILHHFTYLPWEDWMLIVSYTA